MYVAGIPKPSNWPCTPYPMERREHDSPAVLCGGQGRKRIGYRYHRYYICFYISVRIRIRIRIISTMSDTIILRIDITNMRFEYSDTDMVSDVEYPDSDTDRSEPL